MTMDRRKSVATHLMTTAFVLASLTEGPTTSAETIARTFFYNPPANGGPPPDVLAMLAAGKTSGTPTFSVSREAFSPDPSDLRSTSYVENDNFQIGNPSVIDPHLLHTSDVRESNYNLAMHWEPTREEPTAEITSKSGLANSETSTSLEGLKLNEDLLSAIIKDDLLKSDNSRPEWSRKGQENETGHDPQSSNGPSVKLSLDVSPNTEVPIASSTDKYFQERNKLSNHQDIDVESDNDFRETTSIINELSDLGNGTEFPDDSTSSNPVEEMTMDDSDGEITTLISLVPDPYAENGNHYYSDMKNIPTKKEIDANEGKKKEEKNKQSSNYFDHVDASDENHEKAKDNKKKTSIESRMNSIFFSIDEGPNEDGEIKVKLGKALDYSSNQNTIEKNYKDVYQYNFHDPNTGWYKFGYGDNHQWRHEERSGDGVVLGRYSWQDANGREHTTHFVADAMGYRIVEPGQKITMHVGTPINKKTSNDKPGGQPPPSLTTPRPSSTSRPTSQPLSPTTASFPITSVSTTLTLSTHTSPGGLNTAQFYPGTISDLKRPSLDLSVVQGRPPINYPISNRPGSWIFVPSTKRPYARPPVRPLRPPPKRNITRPFKEVNHRRRKPTTIRPLKPLRVNLKRDPKPQDSLKPETTDTDTSDEEQEEGEEESLNSKPSENPDVIGQLQLFFNNSVKYPLSQKPIQSDNSGAFTPNEFMELINFINAFKFQNQEAATSLNRPTWSKLQINQGEGDEEQAFSYLKAPSKVLLPPPMPSSSSSSSSIYGASNDAFGDIPYPPDYAFMDEDYHLMGLDPPIIQTPIVHLNHSNGTKDKIPDTFSPSENNGSRPSEFPELVPLQIYDTKLNESSQDTPENNHLGSTTNKIQSLDSKNESTTSIPVTLISTKASLNAEKSTLPPEISSSSSKKPPASAIWPYIPINIYTTSNPVASDVKTPLPPPPSPQNFWSEVLKRIYYWPQEGPQDVRPTTIQ